MQLSRCSFSRRPLSKRLILRELHHAMCLFLVQQKRNKKTTTPLQFIVHAQLETKLCCLTNKIRCEGSVMPAPPSSPKNVQPSHCTEVFPARVKHKSARTWLLDAEYSAKRNHKIGQQDRATQEHVPNLGCAWVHVSKI